MYNEFKTVENKVLLHVDNFTWGNTVLSKEDLKNLLISTAEEEAKYMSDKYNVEVDRISNEDISEEQKQSEIATFAEQLKQELLDKGYVLGKDVNVIVHE